MRLPLSLLESGEGESEISPSATGDEDSSRNEIEIRDAVKRPLVSPNGSSPRRAERDGGVEAE